VHCFKNNTTRVLLVFLLVLGAGRAASSRNGVGPMSKSSCGHCALLAGFAAAGSRPDSGSCDCCAGSAYSVGVGELSKDAAHTSGKAIAVCLAGNPAEGIAEDGCGRCPANGCGGCGGLKCSSLFLSESVSRIADPGRLPVVPPEDWSAVQRSLRPLLQPPRGV
jgi:hypothetical protein